jgi:hypothetical protein
MQGKRKGAKSAAKAGNAKPRAAGTKKNSRADGAKTEGQERLRPGQLDGLVLGYMKKHKGKLPLTPTEVAQAIKRSSGAVGNCLVRLEKEEKVRLTDKKPRRYDLAGSAK